jgi:hypothetical protein
MKGAEMWDMAGGVAAGQLPGFGEPLSAFEENRRAWVEQGQLPPTIIKQEGFTGSVWTQEDEAPPVHRYTHPETHGDLGEIDAKRVIDDKGTSSMPEHVEIADYLAVRHPWELPKIEPVWLPPKEVEPPALVPLHLQRALRDRWPYMGQNFYASLYSNHDGHPPEPALTGWGPTLGHRVVYHADDEEEEAEEAFEAKYKKKKWSFYKDVVEDNIIGKRDTKTDFRGVRHKLYRSGY